MKQLLKENSKWKNVGWFFRILFMIFALTPGCLTTLSDGLDGLHVEMVFLTMGVGAVCWITKDESLRKNRWLHVLCAFFAFTTVMGTSYHEQGSWNYVFGNFAQFLLALVVVAGYYNLYESLIALGAYVSEHWEGVRRREIKGKIENFIFEAHPFWSTFAIAMLCALPYMISFFPGPIQADAFEQVWKYMGIIENSNKHPVVSTAIMGRCLAFGRVVLGSDNLGIFTYFDTVPIAGSWNLISRLRYEKNESSGLDPLVRTSVSYCVSAISHVGIYYGEGCTVLYQPVVFWSVICGYPGRWNGKEKMVETDRIPLCFLRYDPLQKRRQISFGGGADLSVFLS